MKFTKKKANIRIQKLYMYNTLDKKILTANVEYERSNNSPNILNVLILKIKL